jgi:hypothetical protein
MYLLEGERGGVFVQDLLTEQSGSPSFSFSPYRVLCSKTYNNERERERERKERESKP